MHKYVTITIVVDALISMDKLFNQYIFIYHGPHLFRIMVEFFYSCGLLHLCDVNKGLHILLSQKPK